uniref:Secreted protein n=1 Tax=Triticum urartu TaxID=4572 RepID=A0A8R7TG17_TRIUA
MQRRSRAARWSWCAILAVPTSSTWPRLRPSGVVQCPRNMQLASSLHAVPAARESSTRPRACLSGAARCSCPCSLLLYSTTMATKAWSPASNRGVRRRPAPGRLQGQWPCGLAGAVRSTSRWGSLAPVLQCASRFSSPWVREGLSVVRA